MFFVFGFLLFALGWLLMDNYPWDDRVSFGAAIACFVGMIMVTGSLLSLAWRYLP